MKQIILTILLLFGATCIFAQGSAEMSKKELYKAEVREKLRLDYSMPDYSISSINANVMGPRLAKILETLYDNYQQDFYLSTLSVIQTKQIEGLSYGRVKKMKLNNVSKQGNVITICFNTTLDSNNLGMKKSKLLFRFIDGVSDDIASNDFFYTICRYIRE